MKASKFTILRYGKLGDGTWRYGPVAVAGNNRIKPDEAIIGGTEQKLVEMHPAFFIRIKRQFVNMGTDYAVAVIEQKRLLAAQHYQRATGQVAPGAKGDKLTLAEAKEIHLNNCWARGLDKKTISAYTVAIDEFIGQSAKTHVDEITKQDMFNFMAWLRR